MKVYLCALLVAVVVFLLEETCLKAQEKTENPPKALADAADVILKTTKVDKKTLDKDLQVVLSALPSLQRDYRPYELQRERIVGLAATSWKRLRGVCRKPKMERVLKVDEELTLDAFMKYATTFGYLEVTSTPLKAAVTLNAISWGETKTDGWEEVGTYPIQLEKDGFKVHKGTVTIKKGSQSYPVTLDKE